MPVSRACPQGSCYRLETAVFGLGTTEILVIAVLALMLFSPTELPKILRSAARFWGQLRATADEFRDAIMHADGVQDIKNTVETTRAEFRKAEAHARREVERARAEVRRAQRKLHEVATQQRALGLDHPPANDDATSPAGPVPAPVPTTLASVESAAPPVSASEKTSP